MKKVGIVGGLGPESTVDYYKSIISDFQIKLGSKEVLPELFINSINMYKIFKMIDKGQTKELIQYLADAAHTLENAGADFIVMAANTPHIVFEQVNDTVNVPMISIVEETYKRAKSLGLDRVGLLGTKFTMENDFFKKPFVNQHMNIVVPNECEQAFIHKKIVEELEHGIVKQETKEEFQTIVNEMIHKENIQGLILGCTELPMLIKEEDIPIHLLNTTDIHVHAIVDKII